MDMKIDAISSVMNTSLESPKVVIMEESESDGDDESQALLPPDSGDLSKKSDKPKRKVQWLDRSGDNKLAEILEFQPSDVSDSEEEDSDSCICRIM